jgi:hypothetical protein
MGRERVVTALRLGAVQLCRVSRGFSIRVTGGDFEVTFACRESSREKTTDSNVLTRPTQGIL